MRMSKALLSFLFCVTLFHTRVLAQDNTDDSNLSLSLSLNHDAFFGTNPMLSGSYDVGKKASLTFYGIQWGAGTAQAWGNWTEFGLGANFQVSESVGINPQLGVTMGNLLSSYTEGKYAFGDGIVPNLTVNVDNSKVEGQLYAGYYAALRKEGPMTSNYVHYWANFGAKVSRSFSVGAHYEHLFRSGGDNQPTTTSQYYNWVGPYVQFTKGIAGLRLSGGANLAGDDAKVNFDGDFYKMAFFIKL